MSRHKTPQADGPFTLDLDPSYAKQFARAYGMLPEGAKSVLALCKLALDYVLSIFTLPLEVLLLKRMGPRSMTLYKAVQMSVIAMRAATFLPSKPVVAFLGVAAAVTWWRFIEARRGEWEREPYRYSRSPGESFVWEAVARFLVHRGVPRRLFTDETVFRFWEPATGLLLGLLLLAVPFTSPLGIVLLVSGGALLVKRHVLYARQVELRRDVADAVVVGQGLSETAAEGAEQVHWVRVVAAEFRPLPEARIRVTCDGCGTRVKCPADRAGTSGRCPKCGSDLLIPAA